MKCIRCGHDSKYKERTGRVCPNCRGHFAFEPKQGDKLTDAGFKNAIDAVSSSGTVRWGVEHLYYEVCRKIKKRGFIVARVIGIGASVFLLIIVLSIAGNVKANPQAIPFFSLFAIFLFVAITVVIVSTIRNRDVVPIDLAAFNTMWSRWKDAHGAPAGVIVRLEQLKPPRPVEADIGDYSFDRAVICDRARTVDLLLANNFHFENNCAVLSIEGYPPGPFETVLKMLKRNPKLQVFALHDASPAGCALARRLRTDPKWFAGGVRVIDVGLSPYQTKRFRGSFLRVTSNVAAVQGLSAKDAEWLSRYTLELAVIRPDQLIKRLFRAINQTSGNSTTGDGDSGTFVATGGSDGGDLGAPAGDSDGSFDSFG